MSTSKRARKYKNKKPFSQFKRRSFDQDLTSFLDVLCVEWGFCIPASDKERILQLESVTANEFAELVLKAEGLCSETSPWFKKIVHRFSHAFGKEVSKTDYRPS